MRAAAVAIVVLLALGACGEVDPATERLAQRSFYIVELTGWNWVGSADSGQAILNLRLMCGTRQPLSQLTVLIEDIAGDGETVLKQRLHTLNVGDLAYDQPQELMVRIDGVDPAVDEGGFAVMVEASPPRAQWSRYPELSDLAAPADG